MLHLKESTLHESLVDLYCKLVGDIANLHYNHLLNQPLFSDKETVMNQVNKCIQVVGWVNWLLLVDSSIRGVWIDFVYWSNFKVVSI